MASRTLNRRALRDDHDRAEETDDDRDDADEAADDAPKPKKARARKPAAAKTPKVKAPAKPRAPRKKTPKVPPRMFARWVVFDGGMKRVAVFEYKDRAGADGKLAEMQTRKTGTYFVQMVKDPYDPPPEVVPVVAG